MTSPSTSPVVVGRGPLVMALALGGTLLGCASSGIAGPPRAAPLAPGAHVAVVDGVDLAYHVRGEGPVMIVHPGGPGNSSAYLRMPELERFWFLGHSHGGEVAQVYGYTYPDRLAGLILYSATPRCDATWLDDRRARKAALDPVVAAMDWALQPNLPWPDGPDGPFDLRPLLARIRAPTLVLTGRRDWVCGPRYAEELRQGITGARLQVFERSGHFAHAEEPAGFAAAIRTFVTSVP